MSDLRDLFDDFAADVAATGRPSARELRRRADRRRMAVWAVPGALGLLAALTAVLVLWPETDRARQVLEYAEPSASAAASPTPRAEARSWLPAPWRVESAQTYTWSADAPTRHGFCGKPLLFGPVRIAEQLLVHPSGQRAQLLSLTPEAEDPFQLFKLSYASCLVTGDADSIGGPRNVWSYGAVAGASEVVGDALHVVELTGPSEQGAPSRREAEAALDAWR